MNEVHSRQKSDFSYFSQFLSSLPLKAFASESERGSEDWLLVSNEYVRLSSDITQLYDIVAWVLNLIQWLAQLLTPITDGRNAIDPAHSQQTLARGIQDLHTRLLQAPFTGFVFFTPSLELRILGSSGNTCASGVTPSYTPPNRSSSPFGTVHAYSGSRSQRRRRCLLQITSTSANMLQI